MKPDHRRRFPGPQPELPLGAPPSGGAARPAGDPGAEGDPDGGAAAGGWRLDDDTRRIGLRGIAAARALLTGASPQGRGRPDGRGRGPAGRAA